MVLYQMFKKKNSFSCTMAAQQCRLCQWTVLRFCGVAVGEHTELTKEKFTMSARFVMLIEIESDKLIEKK